MRLLFVGLLVLGLLATGAYSAGMVGSAKRLGGTGDIPLTSPATGTTNLYPRAFDGNGNITQVQVNWAPAQNGNYTVHVYLKNASGAVLGSGSKTVTNSGTARRNDQVNISPAVDPLQLATAEVAIVAS